MKQKRIKDIEPQRNIEVNVSAHISRIHCSQAFVTACGVAGEGILTPTQKGVSEACFR
jgi:hypothetical protein